MTHLLLLASGRDHDLYVLWDWMQAAIGFLINFEWVF